ncbi:hypothetical protein [Alkalihalobacillus sp. AL-G]|uniref:hypothetical protein n=1 Tax=Alkalihalobacillus sp. AL-G TaxID=2926399 RepID=UPI00272BE4B8|nr:hypothetical protein [Alkalihalobacillus sp. AL-G]WLD93033.1 hypothetical protein MOJ78_18850 [Alkalihalobacillus sp. AL-G]
MDVSGIPDWVRRGEDRTFTHYLNNERSSFDSHVWEFISEDEPIVSKDKEVVDHTRYLLVTSKWSTKYTWRYNYTIKHYINDHVFSKDGPSRETFSETIVEEWDTKITAKMLAEKNQAELDKLLEDPPPNARVVSRTADLPDAYQTIYKQANAPKTQVMSENIDNHLGKQSLTGSGAYKQVLAGAWGQIKSDIFDYVKLLNPMVMKQTIQQTFNLVMGLANGSYSIQDLLHVVGDTLKGQYIDSFVYLYQNTGKVLSGSATKKEARAYGKNMVLATQAVLSMIAPGAGAAKGMAKLITKVKDFSKGMKAAKAAKAANSMPNKGTNEFRLGGPGYLQTFASRGTVKNKPELAKPGEDLFVGTYNQSRYGNKKTGLNETHTPHHVVQDAVSQTTHGKGITINIRKDIHEQTATFGSKRDLNSPREHLAADIFELRNLLKQNGYNKSTINTQLQELIRQNKATGGFDK